jgi:cobalt/nickel transport system permease protein
LNAKLIELNQVNLFEGRSTGVFMHIMEGFLPWQWCLVWWLVALPCLIYGVYPLKKVLAADREALPLLGVTGGFIFILSSLKLPSVTGSCSHPTGTGLSTISFGPWITAMICAIVLLFQSLFLAHGGLSVLGANIVSMGIVGPLAGYGIYRLLRDTSVNVYFSVFLVTALSDIFTYITTSFQLALAYPAETGGSISSFILFLGIFAVTQIPLAIVEGVVLALVFKYIIALKPDILIRLKIFSEETINTARSEI